VEARVTKGCVMRMKNERYMRRETAMRLIKVRLIVCDGMVSIRINVVNQILNFSGTV